MSTPYSFFKGLFPTFKKSWKQPHPFPTSQIPPWTPIHLLPQVFTPWPHLSMENITLAVDTQTPYMQESEVNSTRNSINYEVNCTPKLSKPLKNQIKASISHSLSLSMPPLSDPPPATAGPSNDPQTCTQHHHQASLGHRQLPKIHPKSQILSPLISPYPSKSDRITTHNHHMNHHPVPSHHHRPPTRQNWLRNVTKMTREPPQNLCSFAPRRLRRSPPSSVSPSNLHRRCLASPHSLPCFNLPP